jgi:peptidyl-prolyl cis-trans isomerase D
LIPGDVRPFEEVRAELEAEYNETAQERVFSEQTGKFTDRVFADKQKDLSGAAQLLGLAVQRTALFSSDQGEGIAAVEQVRKAAFSEEQKDQRLVSDAIELGPNQNLYLRVIEHRPATTLPVADVRERIVSEINTDRLRKAAKAQAEAVLKRLQAGETMDKLSKEFFRPLMPMPQATRNPPNGMLANMMQEAFKLPAPGATPSYGMTQLTDERYVVFAVNKITEGNPAEVDAAMRQNLRTQLGRARGDEERKALLKALRKRYTVTIAEERL